ncbi:MAG: PilZ domain-containing protein [Sphingomonadales bacterium]|nr:PilZ domain-containing protein [Sphingomonadales bacterium]
MLEKDRPADDHAQSGGEHRTLPRYNLLIRPPKLVTECGEFLCILRDVSPGGFKARLFHQLGPQARMVLELGNGDRYDVERVWVRDSFAGFRFVTPIPVEYVLNEEGPFRKRPVRLNVNLEARVIAGLKALPVVVRDLSQQGARVECESQLALDQQVRLEVARLSPIIAKVRWRRPGSVGLIFEQTFKLDELARVAATLQSAEVPLDIRDDPYARSA